MIWTVPAQLTFFEPFDVYAWRIGWSVSLGVWIGSLLLAAWERWAIVDLPANGTFVGDHSSQKGWQTLADQRYAIVRTNGIGVDTERVDTSVLELGSASKGV